MFTNCILFISASRHSCIILASRQAEEIFVNNSHLARSFLATPLVLVTGVFLLPPFIGIWVQSRFELTINRKVKTRSGYQNKTHRSFLLLCAILYTALTLFQSTCVYSSVFKSMCVSSSVFKSMCVSSSLFKSICVYSSVFKSICVYSSVFKSICVYSSVFK